MSAIGPLELGQGIAIEPAAQGRASGAATGDGKSFADVLRELGSEVTGAQKEADGELGQLLRGDGDLHSVMIAMEKSTVQFQLALQIRNKMMQAYQEIMQMQV